MVKKYSYVGGLTTDLTYDFFNKIAGSTTNCPLKIYENSVDLTTTIPAPTDVSWIENTTQADLDKLKSQDTVSLSKSITTSTKAKAMLVEIDLSSVATNLYGGSNSVLNNAISSFSFYTYFKGSGSNGGVNTYGSRCEIWVNNSNKWSKSGCNWGTDVYQDNNGSSVAKVTITPGTGGIHQYLTSVNKIYFAFYSLYPSDGTIPSTLDIDYVNMSVIITRSGDVTTPVPVALHNEWTFIMKGVSPSLKTNGRSYMWWGNQTVDADKGRYNVGTSPNDSTYSLAMYAYDGSKSYLRGATLGNFGLNKSSWQVFNYAVRRNGNYFTLTAMYNNGAIQTGTTDINDCTDFTVFEGEKYLWVGRGNSGSTGFSESFFQSANVINRALTDNEITVALKGRNDVDINNTYLTAMAKAFENPNMVNINNRVGTISTPYTTSGDSLTLTNNHASNGEQFYNVGIPKLMPNNRYILEFDYDSVGSTEMFILNTTMTYRQVVANNNIVAGTNQKFSATFTPNDKDVRSSAQYIRFDTNNNAASITIRNLSLRRYD